VITGCYVFLSNWSVFTHELRRCSTIRLANIELPHASRLAIIANFSLIYFPTYIREFDKHSVLQKFRERPVPLVIFKESPSSYYVPRSPCRQVVSEVVKD